MIRNILILMTLILAAGCQKKAPPAKVTFPVTVTRPLECNAPIYLEYVGHVVPYSSVEVYSQVEGEIMEKYFTEGEEVKKGSLLFTIDPRPYEAALLAAEGGLAESVANLKIAKETVERYSHLIQDDYVAQLNYDQYVTNVLVTEAVVKQNQANLDKAKIDLNYCSITSPIDGITGKLQIDVGNLVSRGALKSLVIVNQVTPIYVTFSVPERDLPRIQRQAIADELKVRTFLTEEKNHYWEGFLDLIDNQVNTKTGSILMRATFPNLDHSLWPGQFTVVRLILGEQKKAVLLPNQAVMIGQNGSYVFVVTTDMTVEMRPVVKGQTEDNQIIILSGVQPGDMVVVEGQLNLYSGAQVSIKGQK